MAKASITLSMILVLCLWGISLNAQSYDEEMKRGNELYASEKFAEAEKAYRNAMYEDGERFESRFNLGDALFRQEAYESAIDAYREASLRTSDASKQSLAWYNIGNAYIALEQYEDAIEAFQQSLLRNPKNENARHNLSKLMRDLNKPEEEEDEQQNQNQQNQNGDQNNDSQNEESQANPEEGDENGESESNEEGNPDSDQEQDDQRDSDNTGNNADEVPDDTPMDSQDGGSNARKQQNQRSQGDPEQQMRDNQRDLASGEDGEGNGEGSPQSLAGDEAEINADQRDGGSMAVPMTINELENLLEKAERADETTLQRIFVQQGRDRKGKAETKGEKDW